MKGEIWLGGRTAAGEVVGEGPIVVDVWLCAEGIVSITPAPVGSADLGASLRVACEQPAVGEPRRPARVRVATQELAAEVSRAKLGVLVEVGPVDALDDALAGLRQHLAEATAPEPPPGTDFTRSVWRRPSRGNKALLAKAGAAFLKTAPWERVQDGEVLRVDAPTLGLHGAAVVVVGQAGENFGFSLYASVPLAEEFVDLAGAGAFERGEPHLSAPYLLVDFERPRAKRGEPVVMAMHMLPDWTGVPASDAETRLLAALAPAIGALEGDEVTVGGITLQREPGELDAISPWQALAPQMILQITRWAEAAGWGFDADEPLTLDEMSAWEHTHDLFVFPMTGRGDTRAALFREAMASELTPPERAWLDANIDVAWSSYWEVAAVAPDGSLTLRDIFSEERRAVLEPEMGRALSVGALLFARVVTVDDESYLDAAHPAVFQPGAAAILRPQVAGLLRLTKKKAVPVATLRQPRVVAGLLDLWDDAAESADRGR
ncbi:MAG: hypothetical protein KC635_25275 [Myxococcales bacterium]|nr:hypothetical protein [Myxococcales bacterium]MCB9735263.1 hypothetical protein [Deltaproteobacteria bacterium]